MSIAQHPPRSGENRTSGTKQDDLCLGIAVALVQSNLSDDALRGVGVLIRERYADATQGCSGYWQTRRALGDLLTELARAGFLCDIETLETVPDLQRALKRAQSLMAGGPQR